MDFKKLNIYSPKDLMNFFEKNMKYGFKYRNKIFTDDNPDFQHNVDKYYKIRLGDDFIKSGYGICWDFCELEREFFIKNKIEHKCFFIETYTDWENGGPTHTFSLFKNNGKWFWFEFSWQQHRGIWDYRSIEEALKDIVSKHQKCYKQNNCTLKTKIFKTEKIYKRMNAVDFCSKCYNCEEIKI